MRETLIDVFAVDAYLDTVNIENSETLENNGFEVECHPRTVNVMKLEKHAENHFRRVEEISAFYASSYSRKLFAGTSTGHVFALDRNGTFKSCFYIGHAYRINYIVENHRDILLVLDSDMCLTSWKLYPDPQPPEMIVKKKIPKMKVRHIRHVLFDDTSTVVLIMAIDRGVFLCSSSFAHGNVISFSPYYCLRKKDWKIANLSATVGDIYTHTHYEKSTGSISEIRVSILLSVLIENTVEVILVNMSSDSCHCENIARLGRLGSQDIPSDARFAWLSNSSEIGSMSARIFLCTTTAQSLTVHDFKSNHIKLLLEEKLPFQIDLLQWIGSSTIVAINLLENQMLFLDIGTRNLRVFTSPIRLKKGKIHETERWRYLCQKQHNDMYASCLPRVHHINFLWKYKDSVNTHCLLSGHGSALDNQVQRILQFEHEQYQISATGAKNGHQNKAIHFFRPAQRLVECYLSSCPEEHPIIHLFNIFKELELESILIFLLEFLICEGKVKTLPKSLVDMLCDRFTDKFDAYLDFQRIYMLGDSSRKTDLVFHFQSGRLYRLELCLANLTGDFGYVLRKALEFDLYRVLCILHNIQFSDFKGPIRKLRTIGTDEALHILMEYMLLISSGRTFGTDFNQDDSIYGDLTDEIYSNLVDPGFSMRLIQVDAAKFLALVKRFVLPPVDFKSVKRYVNRLTKVFEGSCDEYSPTVIDQILWSMSLLEYMDHGLLDVEDTEYESVFIGFRVITLYEQIAVDSDDIFDDFSKRALYIPSHPPVFYEKESLSVKMELHEKLNELIDPEHPGCTDVLLENNLQFYYNRNAETLCSLRMFHERQLLSRFASLSLSEESVSLLISLPGRIQFPFNYLFAGLRYMRSGYVDVLRWMLSCEIANDKTVLFDFIRLIACRAEKSSSAENEIFRAVFMHCIKDLLLINCYETAAISWEWFPECHSTILRLLEDNPQCLNRYLQGTLLVFGVSSCSLVKNLGLSEIFLLRSHADLDPAISEKISQTFYSSVDNNIIDHISLICPASAYLLVRLLLQKSICSDSRAISWLYRIDHTHARAFRLALTGDSQQALKVLENDIHDIWKSHKAPKNDEREGMNGQPFGEIFDRLKYFTETVEAVSTVFRLLNPAVVPIQLEELCTSMEVFVKEPLAYRHNICECSPSQIHRLGLLRKWTDEEHRSLRILKFLDNGTRQSESRSLVGEACKILIVKFFYNLMGFLLERMLPNEITKCLSKRNRLFIAPMVIGQCAFTIENFNTRINSQKARKSIFLNKLDLKDDEFSAWKNVYADESENSSLLVPILTYFPCGHFVKSHHKYTVCPICSYLTQNVTKEIKHQDQSNSMDERLANFRDATDRFLFADMRMHDYIEKDMRKNGTASGYTCTFPRKLEDHSASFNLGEVSDRLKKVSEKVSTGMSMSHELEIRFTADKIADLFDVL